MASNATRPVGRSGRAQLGTRPACRLHPPVRQRLEQAGAEKQNPVPVPRHRDRAEHGGSGQQPRRDAATAHELPRNPAAVREIEEGRAVSCPGA